MVARHCHLPLAFQANTNQSTLAWKLSICLARSLATWTGHTSVPSQDVLLHRSKQSTSNFDFSIGNGLVTGDVSFEDWSTEFLMQLFVRCDFGNVQKIDAPAVRCLRPAVHCGVARGRRGGYCSSTLDMSRTSP